MKELEHLACLPESRGLYDPGNEHDACGVGLVARLSGEASHDIVAAGVTVLSTCLFGQDEQLEEVLDTLAPREKKVLELRFGIVDGRTRTLEEVGKEFNVTRERIRQIEAKALRKLRHPSRSKKLRDFLN